MCVELRGSLTSVCVHWGFCGLRYTLDPHRLGPRLLSVLCHVWLPCPSFSVLLSRTPVLRGPDDTTPPRPPPLQVTYFSVFASRDLLLLTVANLSPRLVPPAVFTGPRPRQVQDVWCGTCLGLGRLCVLVGGTGLPGLRDFCSADRLRGRCLTVLLVAWCVSAVPRRGYARCESRSGEGRGWSEEPEVIQENTLVGRVNDTYWVLRE